MRKASERIASEQQEHLQCPEQISDKIFTIPNVLSMMRLALIPVIAWMYCIKQEYALTAVIVLLSGLTDILDGYIARRFNMISALGKALDPVADKLTQGVTLLCLTMRFPQLRTLLIVLFCKELIMGVIGLAIIHFTGTTYSARWHGKATTVAIHATIVAHLFWTAIPAAVTDWMVAACLVLMGLSLVLYTRDNFFRIRMHTKTGK